MSAILMAALLYKVTFLVVPPAPRIYLYESDCWWDCFQDSKEKD